MVKRHENSDKFMNESQNVHSCQSKVRLNPFLICIVSEMTEAIVFPDI